MDLLLSLIEKEKLDITQVSLAQVTDQYLEYLRQEESLSLADLSSFLAVAARLILIKSRALLPVLEWSDDEEESMDDLEIRLKEYKRFREAANTLGMLFGKHRSARSRESFLGAQVVFYPPPGLTALDIQEQFLAVLGEIPVFEVLPEKEIQAIVTLEEMIFSLQNMLSEKVEQSFVELTRTARDRTEVIVSFLAVLEMVKQRVIFVEQERFFSDIFIKRM